MGSLPFSERFSKENRIGEGVTLRHSVCSEETKRGEYNVVNTISCNNEFHSVHSKCMCRANEFNWRHKKSFIGNEDGLNDSMLLLHQLT